jgi:hypothetical protein
MKLLALSYRETMSDYFAKRGIPWFGILVIRYKTEAELGMTEEQLQEHSKCSFVSNYVCEFLDNLMDDASEDSFAVCSMLEHLVAWR